MFYDEEDEVVDQSGRDNTLLALALIALVILFSHAGNGDGYEPGELEQNQRNQHVEQQEEWRGPLYG